jgi:hypothetical protein
MEMKESLRSSILDRLRGNPVGFYDLDRLKLHRINWTGPSNLSQRIKLD